MIGLVGSRGRFCEVYMGNPGQSEAITHTNRQRGPLPRESRKERQNMKGIKSNLITMLAVVVLLVTMLAIPGCGNEEESWRNAKKSDTKDAYIDFAIKYPKSAHIDEIRPILKDAIRQMHVKTWELKQTKGQQEEAEIERILSTILRIDPQDALALNNQAAIVWENYYDDYSKKKLHDAMKSFERSLENAGRQRIANACLASVIEGYLIKFAQHPDGKAEVAPLRDLVLENVQAAHQILKIPFTEPAEPQDLTITGTVVDTKGAGVVGQRFWLVEVGGDIDKNEITSRFVFDNNGKIVNPFADTNGESRFSFRIRYDDRVLDSLPTKCLILTTLSQKMPVGNPSFYLSQKGKPAVVQIDQNTYEIDLGELYLKTGQ